MKEGAAVITMIAIGVLAVTFGSYWAYAYFGPKYESVRRDINIESRAYSEASVRRMYDYKLQYETADNPTKRLTILAAAKHEMAIFPQDRLPTDLRIWWNSVNVN